MLSAFDGEPLEWTQLDVSRVSLYPLYIFAERINENDRFDLLVGNRDWMKKNGLKITKEMDRTMSEHEHQGQTAVLCAING